MASTGKLHHEVEVAQRATGTALVSLVFAAFVTLAIGAAVYDIGRWLTIW